MSNNTDEQNILGKIGLIGNGSWGTAIAKILTDNGHNIHWWVRNEEAMSHLETRYHNPHYLTSVRFLPETITPTNKLEDVLSECKTLIVCVPSAYAQGVIESVDSKLWEGKIIVSAIKGILPDSNLLLNDYMTRLPSFNLHNYLAITGPCHAEEVADERISYLTFSGLNDELTSAMASAFRNTYIYTTTNHDIWGVQFAAVLKNIYAIGAGMAHALDYGDNFQSVYITNCYREMHRFLEAHFEQVHPSDERPDFPHKCLPWRPVGNLLFIAQPQSYVGHHVGQRLFGKECDYGNEYGGRRLLCSQRHATHF